MREASIQSRKSGEKNISANTVRKVTEVRLVDLKASLELSWEHTTDKYGSFQENTAQIPGIEEPRI